MSRLEEHFRVLGLDMTSQHDGADIKRAYHKLALRRHPDKGGSKEAFQKLSNAFETLMKEEPWKRTPPASSSSSPPSKRKKPQPQSNPRRTSGNRDERQRSDWNDEYDNDDDDDDDGWSEGEWQSWHYDFFRNDNFDHQGFEDFNARREMNVKERARQRAANVKNMRDYRDQQKMSNATRCTTCGERDGITEIDARNNGLNWKEYKRHPDAPRTCWACKNAHISVMQPYRGTASQAGIKFAKKLKDDKEFFDELRREKRSFHQQPIARDILTRNSEYFWTVDLKPEAERRGWRERGGGGGGGTSKKRKKEKNSSHNSPPPPEEEESPRPRPPETPQS